MVWSTILAIEEWFLTLDPLLAIFLISAVVSVITTFIYKYVTNQKEIKALKDEIKGMNRKLKEVKGDVKAMEKMNKEMMSKNFALTKKTLKPTLITFLPLLLLFMWINSHFLHEPLMVDDPFEMVAHFDYIVDNTSISVPEGWTVVSNSTDVEEKTKSWFIKADEIGLSYIDITYEGKTCSKEVLITDKYEYVGKETECNPPVEILEINYNKLTPFGSFSIFGWHPGSIAAYILFSIILSLGLRKLLKIY